MIWCASAGAWIAASRLSASPAMSTGSATTIPASGPATPMSNSVRRSNIGERIRMNAPMVPSRFTAGGNGMKYGGLAFTL
jgi:hypothetical protein